MICGDLFGGGSPVCVHQGFVCGDCSCSRIIRVFYLSEGRNKA